MKYTCVGCGAVFEAEEAPERCPKCLRRHGLIPEGATGEDARRAPQGAVVAHANDAQAPRWERTRKLVLGAVAVAVLVAVVGAVLAARRPKVPSSAMDEEELAKTLVQRGVPKEEVVVPFASEPGIITLVSKASGGTTPVERAQAIAQGLRRLLDEAKAVRWKRQRLCPTPPKRAAELLSALTSKDPVEVRSYEAGVLLLAALRAASIPSLLAEVHRQAGKSPDPSGSSGAFAVAIYNERPDVNKQPIAYVDAFGEGTIEAATPLDDLTAVAGYYVQKSLAASARGDSSAAYHDAELALRLAPSWVLPLMARGQALMAGGGSREALGDFRQALQLRDDSASPDGICRSVSSPRGL